MTYIKDYDKIKTALAPLLILEDAAEFHGLLSAYVVMGKSAPVFFEEVLETRTAPAALTNCFVETAHSLAGKIFEFQLLLPDDDCTIHQRAESVVLWCAGFLSGLGLLNIKIKRLPPDLKSFLRDISEMIKLDFADIAEENDAEMMLMDIIEFVRMGVILFYETMAVKEKLH